MKKCFGRIFLVFLLSLFFLSLEAQEMRFAYFQTENEKPFYLKWKDSIISSTETGYLILSGMDTGKHTIQIGFPQNTAPTTLFIVDLQNHDVGYLIKSNIEKALVLEDLQTRMALNAEKPTVVDPGYEPGDAFSSLLVEVTGDSSILNKKTIAKKSDRMEMAKSDSVQTKTTSNPVVSKVLESNGPIKKLYARLDSSGRLMTYVVPGKGRNDTVVLFIPYPKEPKEIKPLMEVKSKDKNKSVPSTETKNLAAKADTSLAEQKKSVVNSDENRLKKTTTKDTVKVDFAQKSKASDSVYQCRNAATERDFINLRRKMVDQYEEKLMQEVALQYFRKKCYTALQIKNLCVLFLKEKTRLEFLKTAYPYAKDKENYYLLQSLLIDPSLIAQFNSMLNQPKK